MEAARPAPRATRPPASDAPVQPRRAEPLRPTDRAGVFVLIPAYNEGSKIESVLREVMAHYHNVVVVDDGSRDDTFEIARRTAPHALRHVVNRGQGAALQTAIEFALRHGAKVVVTFDADGQHDVADIEALVAPILNGECDITLGSRFLGRTVNLPFSRRCMLRLAVVFTRLMSGAPLTDAHNGLRALSSHAAGHIQLRLDRMAHASEIIDQIVASRLPWREVPVTVRYSAYSLAKGQSSGSAIRIALQYLFGRIMK